MLRWKDFALVVVFFAAVAPKQVTAVVVSPREATFSDHSECVFNLRLDDQVHVVTAIDLQREGSSARLSCGLSNSWQMSLDWFGFSGIRGNDKASVKVAFDLLYAPVRGTIQWGGPKAGIHVMYDGWRAAIVADRVMCIIVCRTVSATLRDHATHDNRYYIGAL